MKYDEVSVWCGKEMFSDGEVFVMQGMRAWVRWSKVKFSDGEA